MPPLTLARRQAIAEVARRAWLGGAREMERDRLPPALFADVDHGMTHGFGTAPVWIVVCADNERGLRVSAAASVKLRSIVGTILKRHVTFCSLMVASSAYGSLTLSSGSITNFAPAMSGAMMSRTEASNESEALGSTVSAVVTP